MVDSAARYGTPNASSHHIRNDEAHMDRKEGRTKPISLLQKGPGGNEPTTHPDYAAHVNVGSSGIGEPSRPASSVPPSEKKKAGKKPRR